MIEKIKGFFIKTHYRNYFLVIIVYLILATIIEYTSLTDEMGRTFIFGLMLLASMIMNIISFLTILIKGKEIAKSSKSSLFLVVIYIIITLRIQFRFFIL